MTTTQRLNKAYMTIIMTAESLDWAGFPQELSIDMYKLYSSFESYATWYQPARMV